MSRTLSTNNGSLESLNVTDTMRSYPKAFQILRIVVCESPVCAAIERIDQCVDLFRRGAEGALDHRGHLIIVDRPRSARTGLIQQAFDAIRHKAPTPLSDCVLVEPQFIGDGFTREPSAHRRMTRQRSDKDRATRWRRTWRSR